MPTRLITTPDGRRIPDPRGTKAWRRLAKRAAREEPVCWLQLEGCTKVSDTGDHLVAVTDRPDLALVRSNVRGACRSCNYRRGNLPLSALRLGAQAPVVDRGSPNGSPPALSIFD